MTAPLIADISAGSATARAEFETTFADAWRADDQSAAHDMLNALAGAASGSPQALEVLVSVLSVNGLARPAVRRILLDPQDIDDVEQAALATAALKVDQFDGRSRFTTWLFTIASNEAKMLLRTRSRRPNESGGSIGEDIEPGYVARLSTILGNRDVIERAMAALSDELRVVLVAREVQRLDYDEIASTYELPVGTVRSRLHRARAALARELRSAEH